MHNDTRSTINIITYHKHQNRSVLYPQPLSLDFLPTTTVTGLVINGHDVAGFVPLPSGLLGVESDDRDGGVP